MSGIYRTKKNKQNPYFMANRRAYNDERLSWEAKGLHAYLMSKPDNWTVRFWDLVKRGDAGRDKMRRMLRELEDCGYMERVRIHKDDGTFDWESYVYETPELKEELAGEEKEPEEEEPEEGEPPSTDFQGMDKPPSTGLPSTAEPPTAEPPTVNPSIYRKSTIQSSDHNDKGVKGDSDTNNQSPSLSIKQLWGQALRDLELSTDPAVFSQIKLGVPRSNGDDLSAESPQETPAELRSAWQFRNETAGCPKGTPQAGVCPSDTATIILSYRSPFTVEWMRERMSEHIEEALSAVAGEEVRVEFVARGKEVPA